VKAEYAAVAAPLHSQQESVSSALPLFHVRDAVNALTGLWTNRERKRQKNVLDRRAHCEGTRWLWRSARLSVSATKFRQGCSELSSQHLKTGSAVWRGGMTYQMRVVSGRMVWRFALQVDRLAMAGITRRLGFRLSSTGDDRETEEVGWKAGYGSMRRRCQFCRVGAVVAS